MITRTIVVILVYLGVAGFVANGQYCNATNNNCPNNQQCNKLSFCNWGVCTPISCSAGLKLNTSTCVTPTVNVGGNCSFSSDCKGLYTYCNSSQQCACPSSYTVRPDSSDCTPPPIPPKIPLNGNCTIETSQNCGQFAACAANNNTCQCTPTNIPVGNNIDCRPLVLNDPCSNVTDCGPNSPYIACKFGNCNTGTYQCNSGSSWVNSDTLSFQGGCVNVSANVASGQPCAADTVHNNYQLCASGLTCVSCPENSSGTGICQTVATTTTQKPGGNGASNVQVNIMALVAALAFFRFAA